MTDKPVDVFAAAKRLNQPMLMRLRRCAADTSPSADGRITIYPTEARGLVALIDAVREAAASRLEDKP